MRCLNTKDFIESAQSHPIPFCTLKDTICFQQYTRSRNELQKKDDNWVRLVLIHQGKALRELKLIDPVLYEKVGHEVVSLLEYYRFVYRSTDRRFARGSAVNLCVFPFRVL